MSPATATETVDTSIVPVEARTTWTPGVPGGVPIRTAICRTVAAASYGDGLQDASAAIQAAVNACPAGQVVSLSAGTFTVNNGSNIVLSQAGGSSTSGFLAATTDIYPPDNGMITFDSFNVSFTINTLMTPASVHRAVFEYGLVNDNANANAAVPEPASWALMLLGFGGLGAALRSQRKTAFAAV